MALVENTDPEASSVVSQQSDLKQPLHLMQPHFPLLEKSLITALLAVNFQEGQTRL
jgi:hypothetical protein